MPGVVEVVPDPQPVGFLAGVDVAQGLVAAVTDEAADRPEAERVVVVDLERPTRTGPLLAEHAVAIGLLQETFVFVAGERIGAVGAAGVSGSHGAKLSAASGQRATIC